MPSRSAAVLATDWAAPEQWLSLAGSVLILGAYALMVWRPERRRLYFSISFVGGAALMGVAVLYRNAGLMLLEATWMGINAWGLWRSLRDAG